MKILIKTTIDRNYREIFSLFDEKLFTALKPPMVNLKIERFDGCKKGDEVHLKVAGKRWVSHITELYEGADEIYFIDHGAIIPPPLTSWKHIHRIQRVNDHKSLVIDEIYYSTGNKILDKIIHPALMAMFLLRRPVYIRELS